MWAWRKQNTRPLHWLDRNADQWDIALVDLFLGEGTGAGVIEHCHDRRPDQSVFVMTNHAQNDALLHHCKLLGADAVYHKATELDNLVALLQQSDHKNNRCVAQ